MAGTDLATYLLAEPPLAQRYDRLWDVAEYLDDQFKPGARYTDVERTPALRSRGAYSLWKNGLIRSVEEEGLFASSHGGLQKVVMGDSYFTTYVPWMPVLAVFLHEYRHLIQDEVMLENKHEREFDADRFAMEHTSAEAAIWVLRRMRDTNRCGETHPHPRARILAALRWHRAQRNSYPSGAQPCNMRYESNLPQAALEQPQRPGQLDHLR